jgi:anti-sigma B factor antagonist
MSQTTTAFSVPRRPASRRAALRISWGREGRVLVVTASGALDLTTAPRLVSTVRDSIRRGIASLCLDLRGVSAADPTGIAALLNVLRATERAGGRLVLVCGDGRLLHVLSRTATESQFEIYEDPLVARQHLHEVGTADTRFLATVKTPGRSGGLSARPAAGP